MKKNHPHLRPEVCGPQRKHVYFGFVFFLLALYTVTGVQQQDNRSQDFPAADPWIDEKESDQEVHESDDSVEEEPGFSSDTAYDPESDTDTDTEEEGCENKSER